MQPRRVRWTLLPACSRRNSDRKNVRVNSINPGVIDTEGARAMETYEQVADAIKAQTPLGFFFSSKRRHTRSLCDWSSDVCSSDLIGCSRRRLQPIWAHPDPGTYAPRRSN